MKKAYIAPDIKFSKNGILEGVFAATFTDCEPNIYGSDTSKNLDNSTTQVYQHNMFSFSKSFGEAEFSDDEDLY